MCVLTWFTVEMCSQKMAACPATQSYRVEYLSNQTHSKWMLFILGLHIWGKTLYSVALIWGCCVSIKHRKVCNWLLITDQVLKYHNIFCQRAGSPIVLYICSDVTSTLLTLTFWGRPVGLYPAERPIGLNPVVVRPACVKPEACDMAGRRRNRLDVTKSP